jgi:hypothetical protein
MALVVAAEYEFGGRKKRPPGVRKTSGIRYQVSGIRYQVSGSSAGVKVSVWARDSTYREHVTAASLE